MFQPHLGRYATVCLVCAIINGCTVAYNGFFRSGDMSIVLSTLLALSCVALVYVGVGLEKVSKSN